MNPPFGLNRPGDADRVPELCATAAALGIGSFHQYMGIKEMRNLRTRPLDKRLLREAHDVGLQWLMTLQNNDLFSGGLTQVPGPDDLGEMVSGQAKIDGQSPRLTPEQFDSWGKWVAATVKDNASVVKYWEICNEPNCYLSADEYLRVLAFTAPLVRTNAPGSKIVGGSLVNAFSADIWRRTITDGKGLYDYFSYHPYRFGLRDPLKGGFYDGLNRAVEDLRKAGNSVPVMLTEEFSAVEAVLGEAFGREERWEANCLARMCLTALSKGCAAYHHHHGLFMDGNLTPDLSLASVHTMASVLSDAESRGSLEAPPGMTALLFGVPSGTSWLGGVFGASGRSSVVAIWNDDSQYAQGRGVRIPERLGGFRAVNSFGNPVAVSDRTFLVQTEVVLVAFANAAPEEIRNGGGW